MAIVFEDDCSDTSLWISSDEGAVTIINGGFESPFAGKEYQGLHNRGDDFSYGGLDESYMMSRATTPFYVYGNDFNIICDLSLTSFDYPAVFNDGQVFFRINLKYLVNGVQGNGTVCDVNIAHYVNINKTVFYVGGFGGTIGLSDYYVIASSAMPSKIEIQKRDTVVTLFCNDIEVGTGSTSGMITSICVNEVEIQWGARAPMYNDTPSFIYPSERVDNIKIELLETVLSGIVTDATTGLPISGAYVTYGSQSTTTGVDGSYTFADADENGTLTVSCENYVEQAIADIYVEYGTAVTQNVSLTPFITRTIAITAIDKWTDKIICLENVPDLMDSWGGTSLFDSSSYTWGGCSFDQNATHSLEINYDPDNPPPEGNYTLEGGGSLCEPFSIPVEILNSTSELTVSINAWSVQTFDVTLDGEYLQGELTIDFQTNDSLGNALSLTSESTSCMSFEYVKAGTYSVSFTHETIGTQYEEVVVPLMQPYSAEPLAVDFHLTPLSQVSKPTWTKKVLTWKDVANAGSYKVRLYNASNELLDTQTVAKGAQRYDYTDLIENYLPAGSYTATVQAMPEVT